MIKSSQNQPGKGTTPLLEWLLEDKPFFSAMFHYDGDRLLESHVDFMNKEENAMVVIKMVA